MEKDCCFTHEKNWFRYRAAGLVVEDGKVLFITNKEVNYFYTVGGGVHIGEKAEDCVRREMKEETGVDYEIDHLAVVCENFFDGQGWAIDGLKCHCLEFYFLMKSTGNTRLVCESEGANEIREELVWLPIDRIGEYNVKPSFLKDKLKEIVSGNAMIHIVTDVDRK